MYIIGAGILVLILSVKLMLSHKEQLISVHFNGNWSTLRLPAYPPKNVVVLRCGIRICSFPPLL